LPNPTTPFFFFLDFVRANGGNVTTEVSSLEDGKGVEFYQVDPFSESLLRCLKYSTTCSYPNAEKQEIVDRAETTSLL
jgi:hypothetical protein